MQKNISKTVTIGIPAHNEGKNIASLLQSILTQKTDNFIIEKIIVACDGCTDNTAEIVKQFSKQYPVINVIHDGKRLGKASRLNQFYRNLSSDIFITFDGDVTLGNNFVISELVSEFTNNHIGLVGGHTIPHMQNTFFAKILESYEIFWLEVVKNLQNQHSVHTHKGPISAGSKNFLKTVQIPQDIIADDHFLYFESIKRNFRYKFTKKAYVYIKLPNTFKDYMKQSTRFLNSAQNIRNYFGDWVNEYYAISYSIKLRGYCNTFFKSPLFLPLAVLLVSLQRMLRFRYQEANTKGVWTTIQSSK